MNHWVSLVGLCLFSLVLQYFSNRSLNFYFCILGLIWLLRYLSIRRRADNWQRVLGGLGIKFLNELQGIILIFLKYEIQLTQS